MTKRRLARQTGIFIVVTFLCYIGIGEAQTSRGSITGTISDASGAVIGGASVVLNHSETGISRAAASNDAGIYRFDAAELGIYEITVTQPGFRTSVSRLVRVEANRTTTIDATLEVGGVAEALDVSAESSELLVKDGPLRGGNFSSREARDLPLISLNPLSLARTLPGVIQPTGSWLWQQEGEATEFSINGQRIRSNNYLLDGTENNDIAFGGPAQSFHIAEAVEEVSVQTGNFSVEFGRAGGGVFNVVTKSGTNTPRGSVLWRYQSERFHSVSNLDKLDRELKDPFRRNVYGFTLGGPIRRNRTFFFAGFQQDKHRSEPFSLTVPTAATVDHLRSLFPAGSNPRLDFYLQFLGDLRGTDGAAVITQDLGADPVTGIDRGTIDFANVSLKVPALDKNSQWIGRVDHQVSESHRLSGRYLRDFRLASPNNVTFPGFFVDNSSRNQNWLLVDHYLFGPNHTNELHFSYGRTEASPDGMSPSAAPEAREKPRIMIGNTGINAPGSMGLGQYRKVHSFLVQETQTKLSGRHTLRYGMEFLTQRAVQTPGARNIGVVQYGNSPDSAFANFLDDFSGVDGHRLWKQLGEEEFHPNQFRHSYFIQDTWKPLRSLSIVLGLRYENFGQPANALKYPAFSGFDPDEFLQPNRVNVDNNNFGPAFGLAWSPARESGWTNTLFGNGKTVWRAGFQVSYDGFFTQMISLGPSTSAPNADNYDYRPVALNGRGIPQWSQGLPQARRPASTMAAQDGLLEKDFRSPYTERWSLGFQRELPGNLVIDGAYVGSASRKLATRADLNPVGRNGARLYPDFGQRWIRTSQGNSSYHAMQWRLDRRFARGFQAASSYTWSKNMDSTSEGIGFVNLQYTNMNFTSVPIRDGGMRLDRALSDFHRGHRFSISYLWEVPGPAGGTWKQVFGGWSMAGIVSIQSGAPFTILNGTDRNRDGISNDRPDISNPNAPLNSRANINMTCNTGYLNPDTRICVNPTDVHWIEGAGLPNASTVGRNTLSTGSVNNLDISLSKSFSFGESRRLELRWETFNALNHPQFTQVPEPQQRSVRGAQGPSGVFPSRFLSRDFTNSGVRMMWAQVKLLF